MKYKMKLIIPLVFIGALVCLIEAKPAQERLELVEEDMLMNEEQKAFYTEVKNGRERRGAKAAMKGYLWPKGVVPYTYNKNLDKKGREMAKKAMKHWKAKTCITFKKRSKEKYYVQFKYGGGCFARVGRSSARQPISIGSTDGKKKCSVGNAIHEIGHAIGFFHEHARRDRDEYVEVKMKNVKEGKENNFKKVKEKYYDPKGHKYDYGSIMHYGRRYFSKNGKDTITPNKKVTIGQRKALSKGDIAQVKTIYKCNAEGKSDLTGVPKNVPKDDEVISGGYTGPKPGDIEY